MASFLWNYGSVFGHRIAVQLKGMKILVRGGCSLRIFSPATALLAATLLTGCGGGNGPNTSPIPTPQINLASVAVTAPSANLTVGQSEQMKATGTYSDGTTKDLTSSAAWSSSNSAVGSVSASGVLSAKASGACSVVATISGVSGSFGLTIAPSLVSIAITPSTASIAPQTTQQFIATGTYSDGSKQNLTGSVNWTSSSTAVATISNSAPTQGLVLGLAAGATTITVTSGSLSAAASVSVSSASATSISISPVNFTMPLGLAQQFTATASFSDGTTQNVTDVVAWDSSQTGIASISTSGLATARNLGTTSISAVFQSLTSSTSLTVNASNLTSLSIQPANAVIAQGTNIQFKAIGTFNDGSTRGVTYQSAWSSSDISVLAIGASNGLGFGVAPGTVTVTATLGSATASVTLTVTSAKIVSISVTPQNVTIPTSAHANFKATGVFDDSTTQDITSTVSWSSNNTAVATVGNSPGSLGIATGASAGSANITASFSYAGASAAGSSTLTVNSATLTSISLTPASGLVAPGSSLQFNAVGSFSDGTTQNLNSWVTWSSSNTNIATVSAGLATGQSGGIATISAQSGSLSASAQLLVESATLSFIQVTPHNTSVPATINVQFKALGTFANGDTQDLTSVVTWTSSASSVGTISNTKGSFGLATATAPGATTISAAFAGQIGTATLNVTSATLASIAVTPASAAIGLGGSQQFTATGTFSDQSVFTLTYQAQWSSLDAGVATINTRGVASSVSAGTTSIKAKFDGVSGMAVLTVQ